jgi:hypothetical protein
MVVVMMRSSNRQLISLTHIRHTVLFLPLSCFCGDRGLLPQVNKVLEHGDLVYRKWLFAKAQESNLDDATGVALLRDEVMADIASGAFDPGDARDKLKAAAGGDAKKYLKLARKVRSYGSVSMRPCLCDFPKKGTSVIVSLHLARLVLTACDEKGVR